MLPRPLLSRASLQTFEYSDAFKWDVNKGFHSLCVRLCVRLMRRYYFYCWLYTIGLLSKRRNSYVTFRNYIILKRSPIYQRIDRTFYTLTVHISHTVDISCFPSLYIAEFIADFQYDILTFWRKVRDNTFTSQDCSISLVDVQCLFSVIGSFTGENYCTVNSAFCLEGWKVSVVTRERFQSFFLLFSSVQSFFLFLSFFLVLPLLPLSFLLNLVVRGLSSLSQS